MTDPNRPHDALFKQVFSSTEHAASILRKILPAALARQIDWASLKLCSGSHVDALLADSHADLLFSARVAEKPALLYLLFEHQSSPDELMPLRLLKYVVRVLEWHTKELGARGEPVLPLPMVIPIVLHHSERGWSAATRMEQLFDAELLDSAELRAFVPHLSFVLDDISHLSDDALLARALGMLPTLALWALRDGRNPERINVSLARWAWLVARLAAVPSGRDALFTIFRYLSVVADLNADTLYTVIQSQAPEAKDVLMTLAEQWKAEGEAKGRAEGEAKGRVSSILQILGARQKVLTPGQRAVIERCTDIARLDAWLVKAATLSETRELFDQTD
jgi:predicted transposase/invertase (TIGR01784 family)